MKPKHLFLIATLCALGSLATAAFGDCGCGCPNCTCVPTLAPSAPNSPGYLVKVTRQRSVLAWRGGGPVRSAGRLAVRSVAKSGIVVVRVTGRVVRGTARAGLFVLRAPVKVARVLLPPYRARHTAQCETRWYVGSRVWLFPRWRFYPGR